VCHLLGPEEVQGGIVAVDRPVFEQYDDHLAPLVCGGIRGSVPRLHRHGNVSLFIAGNVQYNSQIKYVRSREQSYLPVCVRKLHCVHFFRVIYFRVISSGNIRVENL
jgi:hypothetical protein